MQKNYHKVSLSELNAIKCPCGFTKRAFTELPDRIASVHYLIVKEDTKAHYHKGFTEIYTILAGEGFIEVDGEKLPVKPMDSVMIRPMCRHRPIGNITILNVVTPAFDPCDEWFE